MGLSNYSSPNKNKKKNLDISDQYEAAGRKTNNSLSRSLVEPFGSGRKIPKKLVDRRSKSHFNVRSTTGATKQALEHNRKTPPPRKRGRPRRTTSEINNSILATTTSSTNSSTNTSSTNKKRRGGNDGEMTRLLRSVNASPVSTTAATATTFAREPNTSELVSVSVIQNTLKNPANKSIVTDKKQELIQSDRLRQQSSSSSSPVIKKRRSLQRSSQQSSPQQTSSLLAAAVGGQSRECEPRPTTAAAATPVRVQVPEWRETTRIRPGYRLEGTENTTDEYYFKLHRKPEAEEIRIKKWDMRRQKEADERLKLLKSRYNKHAYSSSTATTTKCSGKPKVGATESTTVVAASASIAQISPIPAADFAAAIASGRIYFRPYEPSNIEDIKYINTVNFDIKSIAIPKIKAAVDEASEKEEKEKSPINNNKLKKTSSNTETSQKQPQPHVQPQQPKRVGGHKRQWTPEIENNVENSAPLKQQQQQQQQRSSTQSSPTSLNKRNPLNALTNQHQSVLASPSARLVKSVYDDIDSDDAGHNQLSRSFTHYHTKRAASGGGQKLASGFNKRKSLHNSPLVHQFNQLSESFSMQPRKRARLI